MKKYDTINDIKKAILASKPSFKGIPLPTPQRTGTLYQQDSYAYAEAQKLYETNFNNAKCNRSG
jgi:hypothetical protein